MNTNAKTKQWQEDQALNRFRIISPLLEEGTDIAKKQALREQLSQTYQISQYLPL
ncbi:hypothetical protein [Lacrimispora sp. 38-1]|uniref:hypothetical protein n=1 Tax=Lacrimispora sp. 38-1 TaxID=3125778 RepID=UPI003CF3D4DE